MEDNFSITKEEVLKWSRKLLIDENDGAFWAYASPGGGIFIDEYYIHKPNVIRCEGCKYWSIKGFGVAICLHDPKIITKKDGDKMRVYPPTMSSYTCEFAESK